MCRIAGFTGRIHPDWIKKLYVPLELGGRDATGLAWFDGNEIHTLKAGLPAHEFTESPEFARQMDMMLNSEVKWGLLHCRKATHGSPRDNRNNHPLYNERGLIIHNGVVNPDKWLPARGECDSEQILLHVQSYGWKEGIAKLRGWMAVALVDLRDPGSLFLYRSTTPLVGGIAKRGLRFATSEDVLAVLGYKGQSFEENVVYKVTGRKVEKEAVGITTKTTHFTYFSNKVTNGYIA